MAVERDAKGKLLPGSVLNPKGGSKKRKDYLSILQSTCTPAKWKAIVAKAISQATAGDKAARKWLGDYLVGRPVQRIKAEVGIEGKISDKYAAILDRIYGTGADGSDTGMPEGSG